MFTKLSQVRTDGIEKLKIMEEEQIRSAEEARLLLNEENQGVEYSVGKSMQRIERDLQHIKLDLQGLEEKSLKIEHIINERTTTQRSEKNDLLEKKNYNGQRDQIIS